MFIASIMFPILVDSKGNKKQCDSNSFISSLMDDNALCCLNERKAYWYYIDDADADAEVGDLVQIYNGCTVNIGCIMSIWKDNTETNEYEFIRGNNCIPPQSPKAKIISVLQKGYSQEGSLKSIFDTKNKLTKTMINLSQDFELPFENVSFMVEKLFNPHNKLLSFFNRLNDIEGLKKVIDSKTFNKKMFFV